MVQQVNGTSRAGDFIRRNMDFFTVRTTLDITPTGNLNDTSQQRFDFLVRTISLRAQPVILGNVFTTNEVTPIPDLPITGVSYPSGTTVTVYNVRFAIEHEGAWDNVPVSLEESLDGHYGFTYTIPATFNNVSVEKWSEMDFN